MFKKIFSNLLILSLIVQASIGLFAFPNQAKAVGNTYYVSVVDGNDTNCTGLASTAYTGGSAQPCPWKTINKVNISSFVAGDSILFKNGEVWREQLTVPSSGSAVSPITFGAYVGTNGSVVKPIINGSQVANSWTSEIASTNTTTTYTTLIAGDWADATPWGGLNDAGGNTFFGNGVDSGGIYQQAIRFRNVAIPAGATVSDAHITWTVRWGSTGVASVKFGGEHTVTPAAFSTRTDWNTRSANLTTANVTWSGISGTQEVPINSPNIASIVTEVIGLSGWASGHDISIFVLDNGSATNNYTELDSTVIPVLSITATVTGATLYHYSLAVSPTQVFDNNTRLLAASSKVAMVAGTWWYDSVNSLLYVYLASDANPSSGHIIEYSTTGSTIFVGHNYVVLDGIEATKGPNGIIVSGVHNVTVQNMKADYNSQIGIFIGNDPSEETTASTALNVLNSTVEYNGGHGIQIYDLVTNSIVSGNTVISNGMIPNSDSGWHGITSYGDTSAVGPNHNTITANRVSNQQGNPSGIGSYEGTGIQADGNTSYTTISNNYVTGSQGVGIQSFGNDGHNNILYNIVTGNGTGGVIGTDAGVELSNDTDDLVYGNTIYGNYASGLSLVAATNATVKNNILSGNGVLAGWPNAEVMVSASSATGYASDYNLIYHAAGGSSYMNWNNVGYNFAGWKTNSSQDANSKNSDPLFTNASGLFNTASDFTLQSTSPAIDTGTSLGSTYNLGLNPNSVWPSSVNTLDQTQNGLGWDIGAYVYTETTPPTVSLTAPTDSTTVSGSSVTLSATASDNSAVAGVQFKLDTNTNIGAEDTTSTYGVTWDSTAVLDGTHTLIAVALDTYGNYATSTGVTVTVHNAVATQTVTPPPAGNGAPVGLLGTINISKATTQPSLTTTLSTSTISTSLTSLQDQIASLTLQLNSLLTMSKTVFDTSVFTRNLSLHDTGADVKSLQQFLNTNGFIITTTGAGSPNNETTLFGTLTYKALTKYQTSVGLPASGYFGPMTREYINKL